MIQKIKNLGFLVLSLFFKSECFPYDNEYVHQNINKNASSQSIQLYRVLKDLGFMGNNAKDLLENNIVYGQTILFWFREGAKLEDETNCRSKFHFHDPNKSFANAGLTNIPIDTYCLDYRHRSSLVWAQDADNLWSWQKARQYYYEALVGSNKDSRGKKFAETFRAVGQIMHLVADSSVPAHVRNDIHIFPVQIPGTNSGVGNQTYESWAKKNAGRLNYAGTTADPATLDQTISNPLAPAPISALWDQNKYTGTNPEATWTTNPTIPEYGLAEFTNANFFSEDTIFKDYPHPTKKNTTAKLVEQTAKDGKADKVWYIQGYTSERLAAYSYFNKWLLPDKWEYNLDNFVYQDYASQLIPRAVGYSAGLLNYFFRGDIDMVSDDASGSGYVIVNNSDENMEGTFELWYDDKNDERKLAQSWSLNIGKKSLGNNKSTNIIFTLPTDAKILYKFILVFKGQVGQEQGAVVGKDVELRDEGIFLITYKNGLQQLFLKIGVVNGQYRISPVNYEVPVSGYDGANNTWTVVSNPDNTKHYLIFQYGQFPYNYIDYIKYYGLLNDKPYVYGFSRFGTNAVWRPNDFTMGSQYSLPRNYEIWRAMDGNYSIYALGRHNYTLDIDGKMITRDDSVWKNTTQGCSADYIYRYKTEQSGHNFVNGEIVATDQLGKGSSLYVPGQGQTSCSGSSITNDIVAALGNGKILNIKKESFYIDNPRTDKFVRDEKIDYQYSYEYCYDTYQGNWHKYLVNVSGTLVIPISKTEINDISAQQTLKIAGIPFEVLETLRLSNVEGGDVGYVKNENTSTTIVDVRVVSGPCPTKLLSGSPNNISIDRQSTINNKNSDVTVHDYDNVNGDDIWAVIFSEGQTLQNDETMTEYSYPLIFGTSSWRTGAFLGVESRTSKTTSTGAKVKSYILAYKIQNNSVQKIPLFSISTQESYGLYWLDYDLTGISIQMNKNMIVYTYILQKREGNNYVFYKRMIGIINISNPNLSIGYRQEFEIPNENFSIAHFDYTQKGAIGIHRIVD